MYYFRKNTHTEKWKERNDMTEKEKRDNGQIYNPNYDEELGGEMLKAKDLCHEYNWQRF